MTLERTVLLVTACVSRAQELVSAIHRTGHRVLVVSTFEAAKQQLAGTPHLLVTDLKLGAYNGLHLALRAAAIDIPAIVIADPSFETEVEQMGATWLSSDADADELQAMAIRLLQGAGASHAAFGWYDADQASTSTALTNWEPSQSENRH